MLNWLRRNAEPLEAAGAIITALAALTALVVIPYQVGQADRIQRDQTAREIYREFLALTVNKPELAGANYCALDDANHTTSYEAYVEYLLYTAEQMIDTSADWQVPMQIYLAGHMPYFCSSDDWSGYAPDVQDTIMALRTGCTAQMRCP